MVAGLSIKECMYMVLRSTYEELVAIERIPFLYIGNDMTERHHERRRSLKMFQPPARSECSCCEIDTGVSETKMVEAWSSKGTAEHS